MSIAGNLLARLSDIFGIIPYANRNFIVDGCFENFVNQSIATSSNTGTRNAATMYLCHPGVGGSATFSQVSMGGSGDDVKMATPSGNWLSAQQTVASTGTVAASTASFVSQEVENVDTLNRRSATFSVWLACASGTVTIPAIIARQTFGRTGSPSTQVSVDKSVSWVVTTTPKRFSVRLDFPTTSGKTITAGSSLQIGIWFPPGTTFQLYMSQWQLEQSLSQTSGDVNGSGGLPTQFEYRGQELELRRVQRYYRTIPFAATQVICPGVVTGSGNGSAFSFNVMETPMRATPTASQTVGVTVVGPATSWNTGGTIQALDPQRWYISLAGVGTTIGQAVYFTSTAGGAGAFIFDARL